MKTLLCVLALSASAASSAAASCLDFEGPAPGTSAGVGPLLSLPDGDVFLRRFFWLPVGSTVLGVATVVASNHAAGSVSQELQLNNINLRVVPLKAANIATFNYADFGGNVNLWCNGVLSNTNDLSAAPAVLGGCSVAVTRINMFGFHFGTVTLTGNITEFGLGGQEFFADDVCW